MSIVYTDRFFGQKNDAMLKVNIHRFNQGSKHTCA